MDLSLDEAGALLGKNGRQLRYLIRDGRLPARKVKGRWVVAADELPLTDDQQRAALDRLRDLRAAVDEALAPGAAGATKLTGEGGEAGQAGVAGQAGAGGPKRRFSIADLRAFQAGHAAFRAVVDCCGRDDPAARQLERSLDHLSQGCHGFHPPEKAEEYTAARKAAASAALQLLLGGAPDDGERAALVARIEQAYIPEVAGLIRATERRARRARFDRYGVGAFGGRP